MNKKQKVVLKFKDDSFVNQLMSLLMRTGKVKIVGLGIFEIKKIAEREGYSVNDGKRIIIPAHSKIAFRPTKKLKDSIQEYEGD
jgi:nucleoid DNA-binding protein